MAVILAVRRLEQEDHCSSRPDPNMHCVLNQYGLQQETLSQRNKTSSYKAQSIKAMVGGARGRAEEDGYRKDRTLPASSELSWWTLPISYSEQPQVSATKRKGKYEPKNR